MSAKCTGCDRPGPEDDNGRVWWHCRGYFKISGTFCPDCYDKISHDSYGQPERPNDYLLMLMKLGVPQ